MKFSVRIVSLIPEATEILAALGLGDDVVTIPPDDAQDIERLVDALRVAQPALIFSSETRAGGGVPRHRVRRAVARMARKPRPAVYALEPRSVGEILSDVKTVGDAVRHQATARSLIEALRARIDAVSLRSARALAEGGPRRVVCLHGADPPVAAGWWLAELVGMAGGFDALDGVGRPPRIVRWQEIQAARPDLVVWVKGRERAPMAHRPVSAEVETLLPLPRARDDRARPREYRPADDIAAAESYAQRRGLGGGGSPAAGQGITPGPGIVDLLEQLVALILLQRSGSLDQPERQDCC